MDETFDLCVIGGGSGGLGAALAAARAGLRVVLVEKGESLGGNAVRGGVSNWEPGVGGTALPFEIYRRLKGRRNAVWVAKNGRHCSITPPGQDRFPGGETVMDPDGRYAQTLWRSANPPLTPPELFGDESGLRRVVFEPEAYTSVVEAMLEECRQVRVRLGTGVSGARVVDGRIESVSLDDGGSITARYFVDATASAALCALAGCERLSGRDAHSRFGEPDAPETATTERNGVTLIYRAGPLPADRPEPLPVEAQPCWWARDYPMAVFTHMPAGGLMVNMLPTMEGDEFAISSYPAAMEECRRRVRAHWAWMRHRWPEFADFGITWIAPAAGVREGPRVRARETLTQHDLMAGFEGQTHPDIIALADHAMDRHGGEKGCRELLQPYGVPYRSLLPMGLENVAVASRAAGFSSIVASSCRLSRTMMDLGHAAGVAVALADESGCGLTDVSPARLRTALREKNAWIDWPMPEFLREHLQSEE